MKKVFGLLGITALLLSSCKDDDGMGQTSFIESPRFYINATVDGLPLNLRAGESGYQMYTSYEVQDSVLKMKGILAVDTPQLKRALCIVIRGSEIIANSSSPDPGTALQQGPLPYSDPSGSTVQPGYYDYFFAADTINGHIPLMWKTPNSSYYGDSCSLIGINQENYNSFSVEMQSQGPLSCTPSVKHTIYTGQSDKAQVYILKSTNSELQAEVQSRIGNVKNVNWQIAGQNAGSGTMVNHSVIGFQPGYRVKAEIEFESGGIEIIEKVVLPGSPTCDINIDYRKQGHRVPNAHNLATVELQYFDQNGKMYSSAYPNAQGYFEIESLGEYLDAAASSHKHKRFSFLGDAILKSADGSTLQVNNIFGSFAVAYP
ncbi:hypothetical protein [Croceimicrobium hydrocarbonivorans]|uniref:Lipoprotein n=1 Tax=Croceimicrobium hydrocarbonivorans TaxID=2761580 RepID=A0A7H0VJJ5_9FLAO|nr:hypothetical protein [Croceimicrobium hydrocarbonivorans]QNR25893.1 hypothetical protein H4K34_08615 [Croceimicrobium hydrocarbonivorans]